MIEPRPNELTATVNVERFDDVPGDVTSAADVERWHRFREAYHRAQQLDWERAFPLQIDLELNSTCNLTCGFCVHGHEAVVPRKLGWPLFRKVIDEGEEYGLCSVKLNYINEPLLDPNIAAYVNYAKARGVLNVYFATNGVMLTRAVAERLIHARVNKLLVSLDATTPETFKLMRQSDKFDLIVRNVEQLIELRRVHGVTWPLVRVNFLRTRLNAHEADDFLRQWRGVADMVGFQTQVGLPGVEDGVMTGQDVDTFRCSFPFKLVVVDAAGSILPCCTFSGREMPLGNVRETSIHNAWTGERMTALRRRHYLTGYTEDPVCYHCVRGVRKPLVTIAEAKP